MDSLELPQDIIWDGDQSPTLSPAHYSDASAEEILIFEDCFATALLPNDDELSKPTQTISTFSPELFEELLELQQDFLDTMIEEDQPSNEQWLDQPILPLGEYVPAQDARIYPVNGNTAQLMNGFNQVYENLTHLTPPETPPPQTPPQAYLNDANNQFYTQPNTNYQLPVGQQYQSPPSEPEFPTILEQAISLVQSATTSFDDVALAEVEALVRSHAENLSENSIDEDCSSYNGSSSCYSPRSEASSSATDDSDWTLNQSTPAIAAALKKKEAKQKRKPRANRRSVEDRQSRKKEQNKSAANRYRLKKKVEIEILLDEERDLIKRNDTLLSQYEDVNREVRYIKSLLRELFKTKGLIE